jgi:hypothetical protein
MNPVRSSIWGREQTLGSEFFVFFFVSLPRHQSLTKFHFFSLFPLPFALDSDWNVYPMSHEMS